LKPQDNKTLSPQPSAPTCVDEQRRQSRDEGVVADVPEAACCVPGPDHTILVLASIAVQWWWWWGGGGQQGRQQQQWGGGGTAATGAAAAGAAAGAWVQRRQQQCRQREQQQQQGCRGWRHSHTELSRAAAVTMIDSRWFKQGHGSKAYGSECSTTAKHSSSPSSGGLTIPPGVHPHPHSRRTPHHAAAAASGSHSTCPKLTHIIKELHMLLQHRLAHARLCTILLRVEAVRDVVGTRGACRGGSNGAARGWGNTAQCQATVAI
jgi:hypothetical protein